MKQTTRRKIKTGGILLAAGSSKRFGPSDKLFAILDSGLEVIDFPIHALNKIHLDKRICITRDRSTKRLSAKNSMHGWEIFCNPQAQDGLHTSLLMGLKVVFEDQEIERCVIHLGDLISVTPDDLTHLLNDPADIVVSRFEKTFGPPLALSRTRGMELIQALNDGALSSKKWLSEKVKSEVTIPNAGLDIDTLEDIKNHSPRSCGQKIEPPHTQKGLASAKKLKGD